MRRLSYILIAAGLIIMLIPQAGEWLADWRQRQLLQQMEETLLAPEDETVRQLHAQAVSSLSEIFRQEAEGDAALDGPGEEAQGEEGSAERTPEALQPSAGGGAEAQSPPKAAVSPADQAIAIISADKINLRLPVLEGATEENMKYAAAHMKETAPLGEIGNAAIAAHRARTKGRLFNRLNELEPGDEINIAIKGETIVYTVFQVLRVEPEDVSVLNGSRTESLLTLITCDPVVNATHRLIVQAKRQD